MKKAVFLLLLVGALGYANRCVGIEDMQGSAQQILDRELKNNALVVDAVNAPRLAFIPFVGPTEWRSYLFLAGKNGRSLNPQKCPLTADYEMKLSDTNTLSTVKTVMRVYLEALQQCSDVVQAKES